MLAIRMQRTGRKGHAEFRVVVQESHRTPSSAKTVAVLGNYNPHTKVTSLDSAKAATFLSNGAQPSDRVARLLQSQGVELPKWVKLSDPRSRNTRNPSKLRSNTPAATEEAEELPPVETDTASGAAEAASEGVSADKVADDKPDAEDAPTAKDSSDSEE